jgi:DNA-binding transcriptional MerR regulator
MEPDTPTYSIDELAALTGVKPRNIRFYTTEGLLAPPVERGRYTDSHRNRLRLIRRLTVEFVRLEKIRAQLERMTDAEVEASLREHGEDRPLPEVAFPAPLEPRPHPQEPHPQESAAAYIARVLGTPPPAPAAPPILADAAEKHPPLLMSLAAAVRRARRQKAPEAGGRETWERIAMAPGVELHVRTPISPEAQEIITQIVDTVRELQKPHP